MYFGYTNYFNRMIQYGVVAAGVECEKALTNTFPSLFTDVRFYMDWILNNIRP